MPITAESTITSIGCTFLIQPTVERANMPNDAKSRGLILKLSCQKGEKTVIKTDKTEESTRAQAAGLKPNKAPFAAQ